MCSTFSQQNPNLEKIGNKKTTKRKSNSTDGNHGSWLLILFSWDWEPSMATWLWQRNWKIGKLYNYRFFIYLLWIISIILHLDHRCRSGLRLRATSFVDDIARWGTVTPLALNSHDYDHVFIFTRIDSIPGLLHGFHSYL